MLKQLGFAHWFPQIFVKGILNPLPIFLVKPEQIFKLLQAEIDVPGPAGEKDFMQILDQLLLSFII